MSVDSDMLAAFHLWTQCKGDPGKAMEDFRFDGKELLRRGATPNAVMDLGMKSTVAFRWAESAYVDLTCGHRFAAALMCTDISDADVVLPWSGLRVLVPPGLLDVEDRRYCRIYAAHSLQNPTETTMVMSEREWLDNSRPTAFNGEDTCAHVIGVYADPGAMLLDVEIANECSAQRGKERAMTLARRLLVGLLHTIQHTNNFSERRGNCKTERSEKRDGPPDHRVFVCGNPIKIDCQPKVREWIAGSRKGAPPTVQHLVRGHYKRQVIGIGRTGRKVIWVEPYWRGPEDAPIMVRPYKVGSSETEAKST